MIEIVKDNSEIFVSKLRLNMKKYVIFGLMMCAILILCCFLRITVKDNKRLSDNCTALQEGVTFYKTSDSLNAASVQVLTLSNAEFKQHNADLVKDAASLNLKVKRLESASKTATETVYDKKVERKDSIVYRDGRIDTIKCVDYADNYLYFNLCDSDLHISIKDTLVQFVHRVPRQWLFFKWGTKAIRQEVLMKNPNTTISYTEFIYLKRKKK